MARWSGVYVGGTTVAPVDAFATWRRRPVDLVNVFTGAGWSSLEAPFGVVPYEGTAYGGSKLFLSIQMLPNDTSTTLAIGATGAYDAHWTATGTFLVAHGAANCWVRLGHEPNLDSSQSSFNANGARNGGVARTTEYRQYWKRIVDAMRAAGFTGKFVYSPSAGTNTSLVDPQLGYAGDAYVDAVMPDSYDKYYNHYYTTVTDDQRWANILQGLNASGVGGTRGLDFWRDFCKLTATRSNQAGTLVAATKKLIFGLSEWGVWDTESLSGTMTQGGGGDNPVYIRHIAQYLSDARSTAGGALDTAELYFNVNASDGGHQLYPGGTTPNVFTQAAAEYQNAFAGGRLPVAAFRTPLPVVGGRLFVADLQTTRPNIGGRLVAADFGTPQTAPTGGKVLMADMKTNVSTGGVFARVSRAALRVPGEAVDNIFTVVGGVKKPVVAIHYVDGSLVKHPVTEVDTVVGGVKKLVWPQASVVQPPDPDPNPNPVRQPVVNMLNDIGTSGALWGLYVSGNNYSAVTGEETEAGRVNDIIKTYVSTKRDWPNSTLQGLIGTQSNPTRIPHISFPWRATGGNGLSVDPLLPNPASSNGSLGSPYNECYLYSQMYDGSADAWIDALCAHIQPLLGGLPYWLFDFNHEPEATKTSATATPSASAQIRMGCFSDPDWYFSGGVSVSTWTQHKQDVLQEYVRAYQYLTNRMRANGIDNFISICTHASFTRPDWQHQALYNPDCDGFGWDPYGGTDVPTKWGAGYSRIDGGIFNTWSTASGSLAGTTLDTQAKLKPRFIQEWGELTSPGDSAFATYVSTVNTALHSMPMIKACTLYSAGGGNIMGLPLTLAAFEQAGADPYVNRR